MNGYRNILITHYQVFLVGLILLSGVLLLYNYLLVPQNLRVAELTTAKSDLEQKTAIIQEFAKENPDADMYLAQIEKRAIGADRKLPSSFAISDCLLQLEKAAADSGVRLSEFKPGQKISKAGYQELPVEITIKGTFVQTLAFLHKLENTERFVSVNSVNIKSRQGMLDSRLSIIIYSM